MLSILFWNKGISICCSDTWHLYSRMLDGQMESRVIDQKSQVQHLHHVVTHICDAEGK